MTTPPPRTLPPIRKNGSPDSNLTALDPSWDLGPPKLPTFGAPPNPGVLTGADDGELPGFIPPEFRSREITGAGIHYDSVHGPSSTVPRTERAASQRPENQPTTARPAANNTFPVTMQIILATLTAALVVALGLLLLRKDQPAPAPQVFTVEVARAQDPPPPVPVEPAPPKPEPKPEPPLAKSAAVEPPKPSQTMPDPSTLGDALGYIEVKGPAGLDVYLNGVKRGPTNEVLAVPCGHFFLRLSPHVDKPTNAYVERYPTWIGPGQSAFVACRSATVILAKLPAGNAPTHGP